MARLTRVFLGLAAAWQLVYPVSSMPMGCADDTANCNALGCCATLGHTCFEKDERWAVCKATCTPGIDPRDLPEFQTPWSCTVVARSSDSVDLVIGSVSELREDGVEEAGAGQRRLRSGRVEVLSGSPKSSSWCSRLVGVIVAALVVLEPFLDCRQV